MATHIFKVWNQDRSKGKSVSIALNEANLVTLLLQAASQKLTIAASKIVTEDDGTEIDDDDVLISYTKPKVLIALEDGQQWFREENAARRTPFDEVQNLQNVQGTEIFKQNL